ncbi:DMT family transporter [Maridesulfovibrio zosterae]|uniref:DMT family transporter n=1 Tax=Maridesulfovibrio zosterae TaxID=82171 RepID=UPI0004219828|nr:DMT family transporter [Maridesulfovibrio zosterae]
MLKEYINLSLAMFIVGSSVVAGKIMVESLPVFLSSAMRFALASLVMLPILFFKEGGLPRLSRLSCGVLVLQSFCGSFLFTVCLLYGLKYISPASAGIITSTTPAFMGVLGWGLFKDKLSGLTIAGICFSIAGVMVLSTGASGGSGVGNMYGFLLVLGAVLAESLFLVLRKWVKEPLSPLAVTTLISLLGFFWFLPSGVYEFMTTDLNIVQEQSWLALVYYGLVVTALAYLLWFAGIIHVQASIAGIFTGIMPVTAVCLSSLVLGEELHWTHLAGCILVFIGILLISGILGKCFLKNYIIKKIEI